MRIGLDLAEVAREVDALDREINQVEELIKVCKDREYSGQLMFFLTSYKIRKREIMSEKESILNYK